MLKDILFIPGHTQQVEDLQVLSEGLQEIGWQMVPVTMDWSGVPNAERFAEQALDQTGLRRFDAVGGFSYGGAGALVATSRLVEAGHPPEKMLLCSPSALFDDDNRSDVEPVAVDPLLKTIFEAPVPIEAHLLYGRREVASIQDRAARLVERGLRPTRIKRTRHNVESPRYVRKIRAALAA